ncbi:MAG: hypothetical protein WC449_06090 [Candidatus Paceibacterota bacterium]
MNISNDGNFETREHFSRAIITSIKMPGRKKVLITCPFCENDVIAYVWSLHGRGKRCPDCDTIHYGDGTSVKKLSVQDKRAFMKVVDNERY